MNEYIKYDATGLAKLVKDKEVHPSELIEAAIKQIESHNSTYNAVVHKMYDYGKESLKYMDRNAPFYGVPFLLKDIMGYTKGHPTSCGTKLLKNHLIDHNSELVNRFKKSGLVILGKTNTSELGIKGVTDSRTNGVCKNPWNKDFTPGGSSGGSGAAVSSRMVPIAHGGDGGGSIRIPASNCGLVGLKPTRGRNPICVKLSV